MIYEWDGENRLVFVETFSGNTATFTYDYMGRRVRAVFDYQTSVVEERYVWDEWNLLLVLNANNTPTRKYTWGLDIAEQASGLPRGGRPGAAAGGVGGLLAVEELSGANAGEYIYFYDANGNVGQVLDWDVETIAAHYEYDPFGKITVSGGDYATENPFRFSTKYQDQVTDLYYYGYRYYSPSMGRWLNRDPIEERGGLNLYAFVENNSLVWSDYLGLNKTEEECFQQMRQDLARVASRELGAVAKGFVWGVTAVAVGVALTPISGGLSGAVGIGVAAYGIYNTYRTLRELRREKERIEQEYQDCRSRCFGAV